ncbi:MAG: phytanoyl-CoA dioxygenase family protein, partial [Actinomycetota bacterium]
RLCDDAGMQSEATDRHGDPLRDRFEHDGAVVVRGALDRSWIELLAEGVRYNRDHPSEWSHWYTDEREAVGFWSDYVTWREVDAYRRAAFDSPLPHLARRLMGSTTVRFFHEHVLVKEPGATERTPWHHDQPYYCLDGDQNVSLWVALDPVPAETGMRFLAGSHRWNRWFVPRRFVDHESYAPADGRFEVVPDVDDLIATDPDRHRVLAFDVEPGDVVAFHYRTLHDAPGNTLATRRRAVSFRWIGDDATFATRPWQVSPPYDADGLVVGGGLGDDPRFPVVLGAGSGHPPRAY